MVGPFIFFDLMGPAEFLLGAGLDVRPHPQNRAVNRHLSIRRRDHAPGFAWSSPRDTSSRSMPRYIWWNFVSSRRERIDQAKADWKQVRFDSVPGDNEYIPLPEPEPEVVGPKVADYP